MNRADVDGLVAGGLLLVPQFTLAADTRIRHPPVVSRRPPRPKKGGVCSIISCAQARASMRMVETGQFGADMQVSLTNDGPVTFWLQVHP